MFFVSLNKTRIKSALLWLVLAGVFTACDAGKSSELKISDLPLPENLGFVESVGKNYVIFFSPTIKQIPLNRYFDMEVSIKNSLKQVLRFPVILKIDAGMKAHNHGMNTKPMIESLGSGRFKVKGMLFHMSGEWFLRFKIIRGVISDKAEIKLLLKH
ncbi:hypothetical protein [Lutibacter sp.]